MSLLTLNQVIDLINVFRQFCGMQKQAAEKLEEEHLKPVEWAELLKGTFIHGRGSTLKP